MGPVAIGVIIGIIVLVLVIVVLNIKIVPQSKAYVIERLGARDSGRDGEADEGRASAP